MIQHVVFPAASSHGKDSSAGVADAVTSAPLSGLGGVSGGVVTAEAGGVVPGPTLAASESAPVPVPVSPPLSPSLKNQYWYDVMDIVSAMEELAMDTGVVIDLAGGSTAVAIDVLRKTVGVPYLECMAVHKALSEAATVVQVTCPVVPAQVRCLRVSCVILLR